VKTSSLPRIIRYFSKPGNRRIFICRGILTYYYSPAEEGTGWQSITGGIDWDLRFNNNKYSFEGIAAFSDRNPLVPGIKDQTGAMSGLVLRKRQGIVDGHFTLLMFTDQYNPNDIGWISFEQNWYQIWANLNYKLKQVKSFGHSREDISIFIPGGTHFLNCMIWEAILTQLHSYHKEVQTEDQGRS
jgi:hypothetical protein